MEHEGFPNTTMIFLLVVPVALGNGIINGCQLRDVGPGFKPQSSARAIISTLEPYIQSLHSGVFFLSVCVGGGGQRIICRIWFSASITWVLGINLTSSDLATSTFNHQVIEQGLPPPYFRGKKCHSCFYH